MRTQIVRYHSSSFWLRFANALLLCFLIGNIAIPWRGGSEALADPPPPGLSQNYVLDTWLAVHQTLFGAVEPGHETAFYPTNQVIRGTGQYSGHNNVGQPFTLNVIRHYHYNAEDFARDVPESVLDDIAASGGQAGMFWGTMTTGNGSVNVIGISHGVDPDPSSDPTENQGTGIIPVITHDLFMSQVQPLLPVVPFGNFTFPMLGEINNGCNGPYPCMECPNGYVWCPCGDPAVQTAKQALDNCLDTAMRNFAILMAAATATLLAAKTACWLGALAPPAFLACIATAAVAFAIASAAMMALLASNIASCWEAFRIAVEAAAAAACNQSG